MKDCIIYYLLFIIQYNFTKASHLHVKMSRSIYSKKIYIKKNKYVKKRLLCSYDKHKLRYILKNVKLCYIYSWILENLDSQNVVNIEDYHISLQKIIKILNTFDKVRLQKLIDFFIPK